MPAVEYLGISDRPITNLNMENVFLILPSNETDQAYNCSGVSGTAKNVFPPPCSNLQTTISEKVEWW